MKETITIPLEEYQCLREHLDGAFEILKRLKVRAGSVKDTSVPKPKELTRAQKMKKYDEMIVSGARGKKPEYLKKKK